MLPRYLGLLLLASTISFSAEVAPSVDPLVTLRPGHPRLLVQASTWAHLRDRDSIDVAYLPLLEAGIAAARARLDAAPPARILEGRRLLGVSRRVLADSIWFSLAYHTTGERIFLETAERNLLAASAFSDWHPGHFLDVAEMTAAVSLGYDWLYADLSPVSRAKLRAAIIDKGIRPALDPAAKTNWWHTREMNWNQICLGGLTLGALAVAEDEPALARDALELLRTCARHGLAAYSPDGIYPEGPSYWRYGTSYTVFTLAALQSALGSESLMPPLDDFLAGARVQSLLVAPSGTPFNFADGGRSGESDPLLFWFAARLKAPELLAGQAPSYLPFAPPKDPATLIPAHLFALLNWQPPHSIARPEWSVWHGEGAVPLAVFRGPDATRGSFYLALKGGSPAGNHAHMDGGSFVLELDGVRWAYDLGMQNYNTLEQRGINLWDAKPGGDRWRIFRYTNLAHNTLSVDGAVHDPRGMVTLSNFSPPPSAGVTADLTAVLAPAVTRATRRFETHPDALGFSVTDTCEGLRPGAKLRWTLVTRAEISLGDKTATLREKDRALGIQVTTPAACTLSIASAQGNADFDEPAAGYRLLVIETIAPASGQVVLQVDLASKSK